MVMSRPAPQPTSTSNTPASDARDAGDDFAAHLAPEETPQPPKRPGEARNATTRSAETPQDEAATPAEASAEASLSLTVPVAPVVVRPQNSVVTIDLSPVIAASASASAATAAAAAAAAAAPGDAAPVQLQASKPQSAALQAAAAALPAAPPHGAKPEAAKPETPQQSLQAPKPQSAALQAAAAALPAAPPHGAKPEAATPETPQQSLQSSAAASKPTLETIALPVAPPTGEMRAPPRLRAGRAEATEIQGAAQARPAGSVATSPVGAARPASGGPLTANAVKAIATATPMAEKAATVDAPPIADAMPAEQRAQSLNEATSTPSGHRATTPAALVAQHIIRRFEGRSTSIDVRLDPPELGRVQVTLEVSADNKVKAVVAAENPATLSDLVRSARELERALQDAGLELDAGGLSFDLAERGESDSPHSSSGKGFAGGAATAEPSSQPPVSRPFGLEAWRGARIDVMA